MQILIPTLQPCRLQPSPCLYPPTLLPLHTLGFVVFGFGPECSPVVSHHLDRLNETGAQFPSTHSSTYLICHHIYTDRQTHVSKRVLLTLQNSHWRKKKVWSDSTSSRVIRSTEAEALCALFPQNEGRASGVWGDGTSALMQYSNPACVWFCSEPCCCKAVLSHHCPRRVTLPTPPLLPPQPLDIFCTAWSPWGVNTHTHRNMDKHTHRHTYAYMTNISRQAYTL